MFSNAEELLSYTRDEGVRFIDIRFCDLPGVMQHFNVPIESFTADNATIATAASIWRPLAASQDDLAIDGLRFLRTWRDGWPAGRAAPGDE